MRLINRTPFVAATALLLGGCTIIHDNRTSQVVEAEATEDGELIAGVERLDHLLWELVAAESVSPQGVAYDALLEDGELRFALRQYLAMLGAVDPRGLADREEKLAFYVNLYNATVVDGVLSRLESSPAFRVDQESFEFFDQPLASLEGRLISLNVLEHGLLRGDLAHSSPSVAALDEEGAALVTELHEDLWGEEPFDPRVHFLLNCASRSCPPLQSEALRGDELEATAEAVTMAFLDDDARGAGPDGISQLFDWFAADFAAAGYDAPADFIAEYRDLDEVDAGTFLPYDWSLNRWSPQ